MDGHTSRKKEEGSRTVADRGFLMRQLAGQLVRSAGSVGANLQEAKAGQSKPDFIAKTFIALKECREAWFWLRLIAASEPAVHSAAKPLISEASELIAILTTCLVRAKSNQNRGNQKA
jgi:four helix bundle protein